MSAPDGRTRQAVDFDGLDPTPADDARRSRVVSFDDMEPDPGRVDARSRVVSFDDLNATPDDDRGTDRRAASFDEPAPSLGDGGSAGRAASFDGLDSGVSSDGRRPGDRRGSRGRRDGGVGAAGTSEGTRSRARTGSRTARLPRRGAGSASSDGSGVVGAARDVTSAGGPMDGDQDVGGADADADQSRRGGGRRAGEARRGAARGGPGGKRNGRGPRGGRTADTGAPQDDETRAREICLRLLTDRARTVKELADTLRRKEIPDDVAARVLERFDEVGLVDDEAFAGQWVRSRHHHKGLGRRAIAMELHRKGVARETADEALAEIDPESEQARARELVDRKMRSMRVDTKEHRASTARRLVGMLARKGYGSGVAYGVVRDAIAARGAEEDELGEGPVDD